MLFFWRLTLTVIKSAIRVIDSQKATLARCGSLASVSDSENDDDTFVGPIASWFILIDDWLQNQTESKHWYGLHKASSIYKNNWTVYVGLRDDLGAQSSPIYRRVYVPAGAVIRSQKSTHGCNNLECLYYIM